MHHSSKMYAPSQFNRKRTNRICIKHPTKKENEKKKNADQLIINLHWHRVHKQIEMLFVSVYATLECLVAPKFITFCDSFAMQKSILCAMNERFNFECMQQRDREKARKRLKRTHDGCHMSQVKQELVVTATVYSINNADANLFHFEIYLLLPFSPSAPLVSFSLSLLLALIVILFF